jgi:hypothetical protein
MKVVNIQYFILPEEQISFLLNIVKIYSMRLYILAEDDTIKAKSIDNIDLEELKKGNYTLILSSNKVELNAVRMGQFEELNPNALYINVGAFNDMELKEAWMYSLKIADDENINASWIKISKELKKITQTGGYSIFEPTNEKKLLKSLRYTKGVQKAYKDGVKLVPALGKNICFEISNVSD